MPVFTPTSSNRPIYDNFTPAVAEGSELIYSDPPYLRRTRTSKHRYRFDYEEADHVELLELLKLVFDSIDGGAETNIPQNHALMNRSGRCCSKM